MRRLTATLLVLAGVGAGLALLAGGSASGSSNATFDVIFDDARGLVAGQLVKIAGAQAGTIQNVTLTRDYQARIEASVSSSFMPFHQDASCTIRPEGLIAENYVECDPGNAGSPPLRAVDGQPPTVPVRHTTEPVSLLDLFGIFNAPTSERLTVLLNELGIATSAQGQDINDILRRANPALASAQQVISILQRQRAQLATAVDASNTLAASAAGHTADLQSFLDRAAGLTALTADHRSALSVAINRLPGMLAAAQPALTELDTVAVQGTPLVRDLHTAVPSLNRLSTDLGTFATAARPGLADLGAAVSRTIPVLRRTAPLVRTLRTYADRSRGETLLSARLFSNLQQHGFIENFLSVVYYIGASLSRYDATSHMLSILLISPDNGACGAYATTPVPACSAHYGQAAGYTPSTSSTATTRRAPRRRAAADRRLHRARPHGHPAPSGAPAPPSAGTPGTPAAQAAAGAADSPSSPTQSASALQGLANYLLR